MGAADNRIDLTPHMYVDDTAGAANEAISPGHAVKRSGGGWNLRDAADDELPMAIAATAQERGKSIGDSYIVGETVRVCYPNRADLVNVLLDSGQSVNVGTELEIINNGLFVVKSAGVTVMIAEEQVNSGGSTALVRARGAGKE